MKKLIYITIASILAGFGLNAAKKGIDPGVKLRMAEGTIAQFYVDTVNEDELVETAIKSMLEKLDPHSSYSNPEETRELNEPLAGNFSGIGITFNMNRDTLYVISTVAGGPSERVGILAGDRIISVNDTAIAGVGMKNSAIMKRLRGPKGTEVNVRVLRPSGKSTDSVDFRITRADIPVYSIEAAYMVDPKTGYVRINRFAAETINEFTDAVKELKKKGMSQLILDLSDNGGGYLNAAVELLGELLEPGSLAVFTEGLNSPRYSAYSEPKGKNPLFADGRLVVMTNQYTASAAEITSGAVQDWDRGVIVGRRTFGKGLVQRPIPFPDGSMMRLTVAHYYTPTGRDIQKPYTKGEADKYRQDITDRLRNGELMHADSIHNVDSLAVKSLGLGRVLYGGGGITPDVFVPLDTTLFTKYYRDVVAKGALNQFCIRYVDRHRTQLKKQFKNDDLFAKGFNVTGEMLQELYDLATAEGVEFNAEQAEQSKPLFLMNIKGIIARDIYGNQAYYKVFNRFDPLFKQALELINSPEYDRILSIGPAPAPDSGDSE